MKLPYVPPRLLLNILLVLNVIACVWAQEKDLYTLQWILGIPLLAQIVFRWPGSEPKL